MKQGEEQKPSITPDHVTQVMQHLLSDKPEEVIRLTNGLNNFVYEVVMPKNDRYIIRLSEWAGKFNDYLKEQWCNKKASEFGIPAMEVLEVGNECIPFPYTVAKKIEGKDGNLYLDKAPLLRQLAEITAKIHQIPTTGYGLTFDWSQNTLSKYDTWNAYLDKEINVEWRLQLYKENNLLTWKNLRKLRKNIKALRKLDIKPTLNHGDIRLKNTLVDEDGKIKALLDWEFANSNIAPYWDISIALHNLEIDEKELFIEAYGMSWKDYCENAHIIKTINILNYDRAVNGAVMRKDEVALEKFRIRLNGHLDFFEL